ncbi:hypothetical protein [Hoeflea prorocentri]|uniref:Fimbrial protein n=1 Tax=Hoeflea prorocentri TaxID=1922333 RepID=A0A9X3ZFX7_9HYPH|nr:hypothetical protein [Hoeflea prorocentri]MCY6379332.1 hypothetical protein [Hoeflea prorocentri]MDA5397133.1 hypothetical protein [Hoeflea prorocentri]
MNKVELEPEEEKPLDPEMEKVRKKMVRLLVVSIGIMILGVMAVLAGVVYKVMQPGEETAIAAGQGLAVPSGEPIQHSMSLPQGFVVDDVALDGSRILFYGRMVDGSQKVVILDIETGRMAAEITLK